jgi:hypothetical protein
MKQSRPESHADLFLPFWKNGETLWMKKEEGERAKRALYTPNVLSLAASNMGGRCLDFGCKVIEESL